MGGLTHGHMNLMSPQKGVGGDWEWLLTWRMYAVDIALNEARALL